MRRKLISLLLVLTMVLSSVTCLASAATVTWKTAMSQTESYMTKGFSSPGYGDEWYILGLARSGAAVTDKTYETYCKNIAARLVEKGGQLENRDTEYARYSRVILALSALDQDPSDVGGYNLLEKLADFEMVTKQGINGPIWALLALDSKNYEIPQVSGVSVQTDRKMLIKAVTGAELPGGGFSMMAGGSPEPDITAMAVQALAPYREDAEVQAVIDRALKILSEMQSSDGNYELYGAKTSESCAQVVTALTALGIDPDKDSRFIKNGKSVLDAMLGFYASGGGFRHVKKDSKGNTAPVNGLATAQCYYALESFSRFVSGENRLYDMTDGRPVSKPLKVTISSLKSSKTKTAVVKWKKITGAKGYQVSYAYSSSFTSAKSTFVSSSAVQKTLKSLKKGKTCYVRIRAYKTDASGKKIYGSWSTVKKVKVK
ncbi:MAG: hypothetical protein ACI4LA_02580 [Emergencia sp.]